MAGRPSRARRLDLWMNGEFVGVWSMTRSGHAFAYAPAWLDSPNRRPLSLSLPLLDDRPIQDPAVEHYFENLLPDSPEIRRRIAARFGAASTQVFDLIEKIGRDCVGAAMLLPHGSPPPGVRTIDAQALTEAEIERLLDATLAGPGPGGQDDDGLRISIAGAQEKSALTWHAGRWCRPSGATPTTHILKLPLGTVGHVQADFSTSVENEWLCARIARGFGLDVAASEIRQFGRHRVLAVERFDRRLLDGWWARLPQEDFCQVLGMPSGLKYESRGGPGMGDILDKLRGSTDAVRDRQGFLAAQLLFWLLAAPDGHAKNFSVFLTRDGYHLTPLYDVLSAWPVIGSGPRQFQWQKVKLAMALRTTNAHYRMADIRRRHWNAVAKKHAVGSDFEETIDRFVARADPVIAEVASQLPAGFPAAIAEPIFEGVLAQARVLAGQ